MTLRVPEAKRDRKVGSPSVRTGPVVRRTPETLPKSRRFRPTETALASPRTHSVRPAARRKCDSLLEAAASVGRQMESVHVRVGGSDVHHAVGHGRRRLDV